MRSKKLNENFFKEQCEFLFGEEYQIAIEKYTKSKVNDLIFLRGFSSEMIPNLAEKAYVIYYMLPNWSIELEKTGITFYDLVCPECSLNKFVKLEQKNRIIEIL